LQRIPFYKQLLSYIYPVRVASRSGTVNPVLDLFLYRGDWQLATEDALYSDGIGYRPLKIAFRSLKPRLSGVKRALMLGTGLGSGVRILHKMGFRPHCTLVEIDKVVLQLALELMPAHITPYINPLCADAMQFVTHCDEVYDLVTIDIFISRHVPAFAVGEGFQKKIRRMVAPGGSFVMNYMVHDPAEWDRLKACIEGLYRSVDITELGINRIITATV
jgi:predicted membrane-bound spermidine synthase